MVEVFESSESLVVVVVKNDSKVIQLCGFQLGISIYILIKESDAFHVTPVQQLSARL